jgi:probable F420-dependent oxidoreductase
MAAGTVALVKIRIGFGLGTRTVTNDGESFGTFVDDLERLGFDSLWLSERVSGEAPDPLIALAFAAARTKRLKLGMSVLVLPGRNPVLLAEELATLDRLSDGRLLPAFGLGVADPHEQQAFGVERGQRAPIFDEALPLLRRLWSEESVDHDGTWFHYEGIRVNPKPVQAPLELWLGGIAPSELRRVGRLGDGWLPSFCTAADLTAAIPVVVETAAAHDREIDPEHFGALIIYTEGAIPDQLAAMVAHRRPDLADPGELIPAGLPALRARIESMIEAGASKFVVVPLAEPNDDGWRDELEAVAAELKPLET